MREREYVMSNDSKKYAVRFEGNKPILFDRYAGDNKTKLPAQDKFYFGPDGKTLVIPAFNLNSMLSAENTKSVCKLLMGRSGRQVGQALGSNLEITPADIPLLGEGDKPLVWAGKFDGQFGVRHDVARVKNGVPVPKERPFVRLPWAIDFEIGWTKHPDVSYDTLKNVFELAQKIGLGTFRPFFGTFVLVKFKEIS